MILLTDTLIAIGFATVSLGTIHEEDGIQERTFWLQNDGSEPVTIVQGYPSCECTTIEFEKDRPIAPGDSTRVVLRFNPRGKSGEFYESGTLVYGTDRKTAVVAMEGSCITSEETLKKQFPVEVNERLRLSTDHFDLGFMRVGESKERNVVVLHRIEYAPGEEHGQEYYQEVVPVKFTVDAKTAKGLQHIDYPFTVVDNDKQKKLSVRLDVFVR